VDATFPPSDRRDDPSVSQAAEVGRHRSRVTGTEKDRAGSIATDAERLSVAHVDDGQRVRVVYVTDGRRVEIFIVEGEVGWRSTGRLRDSRRSVTS
jgi:hypothetical protein